ncbi:Helix-turn-helix domain protein [Grimontia marina]|uniref:Helix-turn-helix domain protein n=2 Tax=Grimontia marina TaxID=646534 RepID=A0A128FKQ7_9GAMM|nr:Helix-turn-helix domain protein [Grimontia marina]
MAAQWARFCSWFMVPPMKKALCQSTGVIGMWGLLTAYLAIEIQQSTTRLTVPLAIYSRLIAIEEEQPKKRSSPTRIESKTEASMEESSKPRLLTEKQVAELIGMSRSFLRQSRMEGHRQNRTEAPPFIKVGRAVRYRYDDIDKWIEKQKRRTQ